MDKERFKLLTDKYIEGIASEEETALLIKIYQAYQDTPLDWDQASMGDMENARQMLFSKIIHAIDNQETIELQPKIFKILFSRYAAAASIVLFLFISGYFLFHKHQIRPIAQNKIHDILPGKNEATLTLANGKKIILSDTTNGKLANQAGIIINKSKNNALVYTIRTGKDTTADLSQKNTLTTANGEHYQVVLPDGTHVWLNAASSLTYPVAFTGKTREVTLTGEAYFEVTHNKAMPFKVKTEQQEIQVLGTHFNVNAYKDEKATTTTLLEGSVKVSLNTNHKTITIVPGQQSIVNNTDLSVQQVDTDDAIAWKNGYFLFDNENLESIMRKISRWYNVRVEYKDNSLKNQLFSGTISSYTNVSQVIKTLELTNAAHFNIDGNTITVTH
jgi:transmembrane sensor